ncbi:Tetracycline resistance protein class C [termite gut metagenome]|uniref:Tetracycline resistance protein class C n=1 Tax=termite gut metagenome TaxID=433724 RepID=A0A5J4S3G1_9ZZZZ
MKATSKNKQHAITFIFITLLMDVIGLGIILPVLPTLIEELIHGTISDASRYGGWLMASYAIMQFIFAPVLGNLSDRFGRRPVLLVSLFGLSINYLLMAFAPNIAWMFTGRLIAGICGASSTTASAYIVDVSTPEKRVQNLGLIGAAFGLGFIIGPVVGGLLGHFGSRVPFFAAAALSMLNFVYGYFILPESLQMSSRRRFDWKRANPFGAMKNLKKYIAIGGLIATVFVVNVASHAIESVWTFFTKESFNWSEAQIGYSLGFIGVMMAVVQGGLIRITQPRLGPVKSTYIGLGLLAIGMPLFAFASQGWMMYAIIIPYAIGAICNPAVNGIIAGKAHPSEQGELQGMLTCLMSLASIIGPPIMTFLFSYATSEKAPMYFPGAPFLLGGLLIATCFFLVHPVLKRIRKE